jgi:hypothetical protein
MPGPCSTEVKWIIVRHMLDGYSSDESAAVIYRSRSTVDRTRALFALYGDVNNPFKQQSGRASKRKRYSYIFHSIDNLASEGGFVSVKERLVYQRAAERA